jgi:hypothetical protein
MLFAGERDRTNAQLRPITDMCLPALSIAYFIWVGQRSDLPPLQAPKL